MRRPARAALPLLLVLGLLAALPLPARAHAILLDSQPSDGRTVPAGPVVFRLHFNSRIDAVRSRLLLVRPGKSETVLPFTASAPDVLNARTDLTAGTYTLRWQVLAIDGHITRGDVRFTVAPNGR